MNLSSEQETFLKKYNIPLRFVYDATGIKPSDYKKIMKDLGKIIAIGVSPHGNCGNQIKDRHGHCAFCNPAIFSFRTRTKEYSYVYVAGSLKGEFIKIGMTKDLENRKKHLNDNSYGGYNDWVILYKGKYVNAGEVENYLHNKLLKYLSNTKYNSYNGFQTCYEIFSCSFLTARKEIDLMNDDIYSVTEEYYLPNAVSIYDFNNVEGLGKRETSI